MILITIAIWLAALYAAYFAVVYGATLVGIQFHREFISGVKKPTNGFSNFFLSFALMIVVPLTLTNYCGVEDTEAVLLGFLMWPIVDQGWWIFGAGLIAMTIGLS